MVIFTLLSQAGMSVSWVIQVFFYCRTRMTPNAVCNTLTSVEISSSAWEVVVPKQEIFVLEAHEVQCYKFWKQPCRTVKTELYLLWLRCKSSLHLDNFLWVTYAKGVLSTGRLRMFIWGWKFSHLKKTDDSTVLQEALFFLGLLNWGLGEDGSDQSQQEPHVKWPPQGHQGHRALHLRTRPLLLLCSDRVSLSRDNEKQLRVVRGEVCQLVYFSLETSSLLITSVPYRHDSSWGSRLVDVLFVFSHYI